MQVKSLLFTSLVFYAYLIRLMSNLSNALRIAVETSGKTQQDMAEAVGMAQTQFSRYCNGRTDVSPQVLTKIIALFPEDIGSDLVRAFLLDQCPTQLQPLIDIHTRQGAVNEAMPDGLDNLPDNVRSALRFIGSRCHERPVFDLVLDLSRLLRGTPQEAINDTASGTAGIKDLTPIQIVTKKRELRDQATRSFQAKKA
jgi:transcriptional regulator with XRE-family HTH domain